MRFQKRILSLVLILMMLLPLGTPLVGAASATGNAEGTNFLGWKDTASGNYASPGKYTLTPTLPITGEGDVAMRVSSSVGSLVNVMILSPEQMANACTSKAYTISLNLKIEEINDETGGCWFGFRFGHTEASSDAKGDWVVYRKSNALENRSFEPATTLYATSDATKTVALKIDVNANTGVVKVYANDTLISTNTQAHKVLGGIWLAVCGTPLSVVIDDLLVKDSSTGTVIYSEDFESLATDVTPNGTVLYQENFGRPVSALSLKNLGWTEVNGSYAKTAENYTLSLEDSIASSGKNSLALTFTGGMAELEILPAATLQRYLTKGDTYVISMDVNLAAVNDWFFVSFGAETNPNGAHGQWVITRKAYSGVSNPLYTQAYSNGSSNAAVMADLSFTWGNTNRWDIEVNTAAGTINVYIDGVKKISNAATVHSEIGSILFGAYGSSNKTQVTVDNLKVYKGAYNGEGEVVYSQDFECFDQNASSLDMNANYFEQSAYHATPANEASVVIRNSDTYLHLAGGSDDVWHGYKLVPAIAIEEIARYTIRYTVYTESLGTGGAFMHFGSLNDSNEGNYLMITPSSLVLREYAPETVELGSKAGSFVGKEMEIAVSVNVGAQTANVYLDGELVIANAPISYIEAGDIYFGVRKDTSIYLDDITITAGAYDDTAATYIGYQKSPIKNGQSSIRFAAVIGDTHKLSKYSAVGFEIRASYGETVKDFNEPCNTVYSKLIGSETEGGVKTTREYLASDFGGKYIFATTIRGIPTTAGIVTFTVTPYFELRGEERAYGGSWTVIYNAETGETVSQHLNPTHLMSIPTFPGATMVDVQGSDPMQYKSGTTLAVVQSYCRDLESAGLTLYQSNQFGNSYYYIYARGNTTVTCGFDGNAKEVRVTTDRTGARAQNAKDNEGWTAVTTPTFTQLQLNNMSGSNSGMGYVLRLSDGRFVVIDGGHNDYDDYVRLYDVMKSQCVGTEEPVVAAWFITHPHGDHYGVLLQFAPAYRGKVKIEQVIYNFGSSQTLKNYTPSETLAKSVEESGETVVVARAGQSFYLADAIIDMLFTPDDCYPAIPQKGITSGNENCIDFRIRIAGQTIMILADTEVNESNLITARYDASVLKADIVQQAHHGYWAGSDALYAAIDADTVFWPCPPQWYYDLHTGDHGATSNRYNTNNATEVILSGNGTRTIALPYTPTATKPQNEKTERQPGDVIYQMDFQSAQYVYQSGFWCIDTNGHNQDQPLNYPSSVSVVTKNGDVGIRVVGASSTQIGIIRPELLRGVSKFTIDFELTIENYGSGVSIWYNDPHPVDHAGRALYKLPSATGDVRITLEVDNTTGTYKVYQNGTLLTSGTNSVKTEGFLSLYLQSATVVVRSYTLAAGTYENLPK